jgi:hypothetical protein
MQMKVDGLNVTSLSRCPDEEEIITSGHGLMTYLSHLETHNHIAGFLL